MSLNKKKRKTSRWKKVVVLKKPEWLLIKLKVSLKQLFKMSKLILKDTINRFKMHNKEKMKLCLNHKMRNPRIRKFQTTWQIIQPTRQMKVKMVKMVKMAKESLKQLWVMLSLRWRTSMASSHSYKINYQNLLKYTKLIWRKYLMFRKLNCKKVCMMSFKISERCFKNMMLRCGMLLKVCKTTQILLIMLHNL